MKKLIFLWIIALTACFAVHAQKENGVVYVEHDAINKTKALWDAFLKGDKDAFTNFFADTVNTGMNGNFSKKLKAEMSGPMAFWAGFDNLKIVDDKPAFPDAINYTKGGLWVQDWLRVSGTHRKTGINIDLPMHFLYAFDKNGKIKTLIQYSDNSIFNEIANSGRTIENGTVYINHPYIVTVRKLVNAWCAENLDSLAKFYSPKAIFMESPFKQDKFINLEESLKEAKDFFDKYDNIKMEQTGYPDCMYYSKDGMYQVNSWWTLSLTTKAGKKLTNIPMMMTDGFDKDGKINFESVYYSTNHFE